MSEYPGHTIRATWLDPRLPKSHRRLTEALDNLIRHDNFQDTMHDRPHCIELQHAINVLNDFAGVELYKLRR